MGNFVTSGPNEAVVKFGCRGTSIHVGSTTFRWWIVESVERLSLEMLTLEIKSIGAETSMGVRVNVTGIAQVKVQAYELHEDGKVHAPNVESISTAVSHFLSDSEEAIQEALRQTLEGHQRQILGGLTIESLYRDRSAFSELVKEQVIPDLKALGFALCSYVVTQVADEDGYLDSLGVTQIAIVKREAQEGSARNDAAARKSVAAYNADANTAEAIARQEAHVAINKTRQTEAESNRNLNMKRAAIDREINQAMAESRSAFVIEKARQQQSLVREKARQNQVREEIQYNVSDVTVQRSQKEREGKSEAQFLAEQHAAKAIQVIAQANASKLRAEGQAEADVLLAKGTAEADVLKQKALAYQNFGEAAVLEMVIKKLPGIASGIAKPLERGGEMVFISSSKGAESSSVGKESQRSSTATKGKHVDFAKDSFTKRSNNSKNNNHSNISEIKTRSSPSSNQETEVSL